jgi:hypothetical protein
MKFNTNNKKRNKITITIGYHNFIRDREEEN